MKLLAVTTLPTVLLFTYDFANRHSLPTTMLATAKKSANNIAYAETYLHGTVDCHSALGKADETIG